MKELGSRNSSQGYRSTVLLLSVLVSVLESCGAPTAVATFAENAGKAIDSGSVVFADIQGSCERRHLAAAMVAPTFLPAAVATTASGGRAEVAPCAMFASEGESLAKASKVVSAYFRAMQQLAAFNSSSVSGPALQTGSNVSQASGLNYTQIDSVSKLAGLVTEAFTERYKERNLNTVLSRGDPSIASITQGFEDVVAKDYAGLLLEEQRTLPAQYQAVADPKNRATILLLNRAFSDDQKQLNRRKAEAESFVEALRQIREGHHTLVQLSTSRKRGNFALAMQAYTAKLSALLPALAEQR